MQEVSLPLQFTEEYIGHCQSWEGLWLQGALQYKGTLSKTQNNNQWSKKKKQKYRGTFPSILDQA